MQKALGVGHTKRMVTGLSLTMLHVSLDDKRLIKKDLFDLRLADAVLFLILPGIAFVPLKAGYLNPVNHVLYIIIIYITGKTSG